MSCYLPQHESLHTCNQRHCLSAGARVHHLAPEAGDAVDVRQGGEEEGADRESAGDLPAAGAGTPDLPRRLPQGAAHAGGAGPPGLHQVPRPQAQAHRAGRPHARRGHRAPHADDTSRGGGALHRPLRQGRGVRRHGGQPVRRRHRGGRRQGPRGRGVGCVEGSVQVRRRLPEPEPRRREGVRGRGQVRDGQESAAQLDAREDLEVVGHRPGRHAGQ